MYGKFVPGSGTHMKEKYKSYASLNLQKKNEEQVFLVSKIKKRKMILIKNSWKAFFLKRFAAGQK